MTFKLFKIFLSNIFSFGDFIDGFKKGGKGIAKNILLIICFLYLFLVMGFIYVTFTMNNYSSLEFLGQTQLFPGLALLVSFLIVFNFGFVSVGVTYYAGNGEEQFLSMPITAKEFFSAKFLVSLIDNAIMGILLFSISCGYFGYKQGLLTKPLFYLGSLITALSFSVAVIFIIYFIFVVLLYFIPCFRKKSILNGIASAVILIMALVMGGLSGFASTSVSSSESVDELTKMFSLSSSKLMAYSGENSIFSFFGKAITGNVLAILILIAISALIIFIFIPFLSRLYIKTFEGVSDIKIKQLSKEQLDKVVNNETHKNSIFKTMYIRDVKGVLREPSFFANGPMGIFLFPLIMIFSFSIPFFKEGAGNVVKDFRIIMQDLFYGPQAVNVNLIKYFACFGLTAFTLFCGNLSSIASTSFSREGKGFQTLKALPITNEIIVKAKFLHALTYTSISCLISILFFTVLVLLFRVPFSFLDYLSICLVMIFVSLAVSSLLIILDMLFDTINPKLNWETPTGAMKQNMNALFGLLLSLVVIALFVVISVSFTLFFKVNLKFLVFVGAIFGIISLIVGSAYLKYADKKIPIM